MVGYMGTRERGSAIVETALMVPWLFMLFMGILDLGFYSYAAICIQNAARAAAIQGAENNDTTMTTSVCLAALGELNQLLGTGSVTCPAPTSVSTGNPVAMTGTVLTAPNCADCGPTPTAKSYQAAVTYQTIQLVPIPGLMGRMTMTRVAEARFFQ